MTVLQMFAMYASCLNFHIPESIPPVTLHVCNIRKNIHKTDRMESTNVTKEELLKHANWLQMKYEIYSLT